MEIFFIMFILRFWTGGRPHPLNCGHGRKNQIAGLTQELDENDPPFVLSGSVCGGPRYTHSRGVQGLDQVQDQEGDPPGGELEPTVGNIEPLNNIKTINP